MSKLLPIRDVVVRVEPKSFFANERTLLDWCAISTLLGSVSVSLMNHVSPQFQLAGRLLMLPVLYFLGSCLGDYRARTRMLLEKSPDFDVVHSERKPILLCMVLCVLLVAAVCVNDAADVHP
eukprot:g5515.t1